MSIEVGQKLSGKVTGITNFGAFVSLPENQSGLVHISEVSDGFVKDVNDYLAVGDEVTVKVLKVTPDGKVNLSLRQAQEQNAGSGTDASPKQSTRPKQDRSQQNERMAKHEFKPKSSTPPTDDFDKMMSQFLKDSEDRLTSLKRNTEGKRGGRGGRRG